MRERLPEPAIEAIRYVSLFDGIGAVHVAWQPMGWKCAWTAEIEPFPAAVVEHHWHLSNLGDVTTITEEQIREKGPVDLVCGGSPCQSFSVAGLRKGMADPRGNLALVYLRLVDAIRPRWVVWENVPGVLSSNGGRDFGAFVGGLAECGYGWAYRVLDAQYVRVDGLERAVPQRRRRVFVVGCLGSWTCAAAVLFDRESLCGDTPPRREAGKETPGITGEGTYVGNAGGGAAEIPFLTAGNLSKMVNNQSPLVAHSLCCDGFDASEDGTGRGTPLVPISFDPCSIKLRVNDAGASVQLLAGHGGASGHHAAVAVDLQNTHIGGDVAGTLDTTRPSRGGGQRVAVAYNTFGGHKRKDRPQGGFYVHEADATKTLDTSGLDPKLAQGGTVIAFKESQSGCRLSEVHATLDANKGSRRQEGVIYPLQEVGKRESKKQNGVGIGIGSADEPMYTLQAGAQHGISCGHMVRRLTPLECERLMGLPDGYTAIPFRGKAAADGPRYRAIGNSMAVNVMRWIGRRIQMVEDLQEARK